MDTAMKTTMKTAIKERLFFCMTALMLTGSAAGCGKADEGDAGEGTGAQDTYRLEEYGTVEEKRQEYFTDGTEKVSYYYKLEKFFFGDVPANADLVNQTLSQIYEEYEAGYIEEAEVYESGGEDASEIPYSYLKMVSLEYAGEDYVSVLYNDVYHMGGAHPYSCFDGITIDCKTGEQVSASQLLGKSDEELLTEVSNAMGLDSVGTWEDMDFYLTDSEIVFFYRMPGFWEDVVLQREK